jgi:hypothetical protein
VKRIVLGHSRSPTRCSRKCPFASYFTKRSLGAHFSILRRCLVSSPSFVRSPFSILKPRPSRRADLQLHIKSIFHKGCLAPALIPLVPVSALTWLTPTFSPRPLVCYQTPQAMNAQMTSSNIRTMNCMTQMMR